MIGATQLLETSILRWYVSMRLLVASIVLLLFVALWLTAATEHDLRVPMALCVLELVMNCLYWRWTRSGRHLTMLAHLQFLVDTLTVTCSVQFAGGLHSPLVVLYNLIILSAGLLSLQYAAVHTSLSCLMVLYLLMLRPVASSGGFSSGAIASVHMTVFCLTAVMVSYYRVQLDKQQSKLARAYLELQSLKASLEDANRRLQSSLHTKSEFLSLVSHELRTPLNSVIGFADLMLDPSHDISGRERQQFLTHILGSGKHLLKIIDSILEVSRLETASLTDNLQHVDVTAAVRETLESLRTTAEGMQLKLRCDALDQAMMASAEPRRLRQVLLNLLDNAVRFTPPPGEVCVQVRPSADGRQVQIMVADTGPGIPAEHLQRIFEPFYQVEDTHRRHHQGAGLGLTIARAYVELQGGTMWAESTAGEGARVYFTLPGAA